MHLRQLGTLHIYEEVEMAIHEWFGVQEPDF
jgi:hypothetical protein